MKRKLVIFLVIALPFFLNAQKTEHEGIKNSTEKILSKEGSLTIGGYGEVHYNQPLNSETYNNGKLDVHRMVMLFGYRFNERTQFVTELEFEHVKEVYVEQAFLQYKVNNSLNLRGGLILTPMGIVNEYHEPTTFNGVERPLIDNVISPSTWREIGVGITGNIIQANIKYQAYLVNGFNGYDGDGNLGGKSALRGGRQKGAESFISSPNVTGKIEYYGISGLNLGLSGYTGKTQSTLFNGIDKKDDSAIAIADSSVVGVSMLGIDGRYSASGIQCRGQFYYSMLSNVGAYNEFTGSDLGSSMLGYYIEAAYNILGITSIDSELFPFLRYSSYNLHQTVESGMAENPAYNNNIITTGLTWKMANGAVFKTDIQFKKPESSSAYSKTFNAGVGVMF